MDDQATGSSPTRDPSGAPRPSRAVRAPRRDGWHTLAVAALAVVGASVLLTLSLAVFPLLTSQAPLREPLNRFVVQNDSDQVLSRVGLTFDGTRNRLSLDPQVVDSPPPAAAVTTKMGKGARWVVVRALGAAGPVRLEVDVDGTCYEFHQAARMAAEIGNVHVIRIKPGPRVNNRDADVTRAP